MINQDTKLSATKTVRTPEALLAAVKKFKLALAEKMAIGPVNAQFNLIKSYDRLLLASGVLVTRACQANKLLERDDNEDEGLHHMQFFIREISGHLERHPEDHPSRENKHLVPIILSAADMCRIFGYSNSGDAMNSIRGLMGELQKEGLIKFYPANGNPHKGNGSYMPAVIVLVGDLWLSPSVSVEITLPQKKSACNEPEKRPINYDSNIVSESHAHFMNHVAIPTREELVDVAKAIVAKGDVNNAGKPYLFVESAGVMGPNLHNAIVQHDYAKGVTSKMVTAHDTQSNLRLLGRTYTGWSAMPKWIRSAYRLGGERVVSIDATALHPNIIAKMLRQIGIEAPDCLDGDSHTKLANLLGLTRDEIKRVNLTYWNARKGDYTRFPEGKRLVLEKLHEYMKNHHGGVLKALEALCAQRHLAYDYGNHEAMIKPHARLYWLMCDVEVAMLREILMRLQARGIVANSCFDAIYVCESDVEVATATFNEVLNGMDIRTTAKA